MALGFEKRAARIYADINKRYFNSGLPLDVEFRLVEDWGEGVAINTRCDAACVSEKVGGGFLVEVSATVAEFKRYLYLTLAHEATHLRIGLDKDHRSKAWKAEVRRLTGLGLFQKVF